MENKYFTAVKTKFEELELRVLTIDEIVELLKKGAELGMVKSIGGTTYYPEPTSGE